LNRTLFRGVTAGLIAVVVVAGGTIAGTALAATPETQQLSPPTAAPSSPPLDRVLYSAPHPRVRKRVVHRASREHRRAPLTRSPQTIAHALVLRRGWSEAQWQCLDQLWTRESNWETQAANPSGAYGIPQALPADKMAMMGSDWRTNPVTQIRWGIYYIGASYGAPCIALEHSNNYNYY
jgi:hypothetical protein